MLELAGVIGVAVIAALLVVATAVLISRRRLRSWRFGVFFESHLHDHTERDDHEKSE
jgi:type II secretory pathway component PulK